MAEINFPDSPLINDTHTVGDITWTWLGTTWETAISSGGGGGLTEEVDTLQSVTDRGNVTTNSVSFEQQINVGTATGDGVTIEDGAIRVRTSTGLVGQVDFFCEVTNAHYTRVQASPHSEFEGVSNTLILPTQAGTIATQEWASANIAGGGGTPGGNSGQIQFNSNGAFAGDVNLTWDSGTQLLGVGSGVGNIQTQNFIGPAGGIGYIVSDNGEGAQSTHIAFSSTNGVTTSFTTGSTVSLTSADLELSNVKETVGDLTTATGTVTHDCANTQIFYHTSPSSDFTANFTNITIAASKAFNILLVISQGGTAYMPTAIQVNGVAQTIIWAGNSAPTGTASGVDAVSFTFITGSSGGGGPTIVLGSAASYGGV